jgi:hypothetical protein
VPMQVPMSDSPDPFRLNDRALAVQPVLRRQQKAGAFQKASGHALG